MKFLRREHTAAPYLAKQSAGRLLGKLEFRALVESRSLRSLEAERGLKNLSSACPSYTALLSELSANGWVRVGAGFKAGVYGHPREDWCLKIMGMGLGDNPHFFCGLGYYLEHEREMLFAFQQAGFEFQPEVKGRGKK